MCGDCNDPFHGLGDDLDDAEVFADGEMTNAERDAGQTLAAAEAARLVTEKCPSCRGTGRYGMRGVCYKCNGAGKLTFKTSREARDKARARREQEADKQRIALQEKRAAWVRDNPAVFEWISKRQETNEFARSLYDGFIKYGALTERQRAAVERIVAQDAERKIEDAKRVTEAPAITVAAIEQAFAHAKDKGIKKPKMKLAGFKFSEAPAHGRNAGSLYVVRVEDDQYLGKVQGGTFVRVRECSEETTAEVIAVASDPKNAAIAYGKRTGNCAICGRELTNHASIDLGIGPICAEKYGWAI